MFIIFILVIIVEIVLTLSYAKVAGSVASYSNLNSVSVFGRVYRNVYELYFDQNFVNGLFAGEGFGDLADSKIKNNLVLLRRLLFAQLVGGAVLFAVGIGMGLLK